MLKVATLIGITLSLLISTKAYANPDKSVAKLCPGYVHGVYYYRGMTRKWQRNLNISPSRSEFNATLIKSCRYTVWVAHHWKKQSIRFHIKYVVYLNERARKSQFVAGYAPLCNYSCVECESSHDPNNWNGNEYWGWYQFDYKTWTSHGGIPSHWGNLNTSSGEQTMVASRITYDAWPNC